MLVELGEDAEVTDRIAVLQDVAVLDVGENDAEVLVDLYGGPANACGVLRFLMPDPARRRQAVLALEVWERDSVPLTLVVNGDRVSLMHAHAIFAAQLQTPRG